MKTRSLLMALSLVLGAAPSLQAQVSVGVVVQGPHIGVNVQAYPRLVRVPGYPVYYDPRARANYFFYDGQYWVFQQDHWYASSWYNGPWQLVEPVQVPLFVLRIPVRYYRQPPAYFRGWRADEAPRWGEHWGRDWEHNRSGWNQWRRQAAPAPAPLPTYQRAYSGERYPRAPEQQREIQSRHGRDRPAQAMTPPHVQPPPRPAGPRAEGPPQRPAEQRPDRGAQGRGGERQSDAEPGHRGRGNDGRDQGRRD